MQRRHESQFYSSEGMRQLQAQIDELWEVIDRRVVEVAELRRTVDEDCHGDHQERKNKAIAEAGGSTLFYWDHEAGKVMARPVPVDPEAEPVDRRVEDVEEELRPEPYASPLLRPATFVNAPVDHFHFVNEAASTYDPLDLPSHKPQSFKIVHTGRGWYQVVNSEGKPIHEGKLRKGPADEAWEAAMAAV